MDEPRTPLWKLALDRANAPGKQALRNATAQANRSIKHALLNAFDKLGNEAFFIRLGNGSAEDRRCLAMILAKLVPLEVHGQIDHALTVKVVTQIGHREIVIDTTPLGKNLHRPPTDAQTGERLSVVAGKLADAVPVPDDA